MTIRNIPPADEVDEILVTLRNVCTETMQRETVKAQERSGKSLNFVCAITMGAMAISLADLVESWAIGNGVAVSKERRETLLADMREAIRRAQMDVYARKTGEIN